MTWHFATMWETISDAIPGAPALACGTTRRSWREYDDRASRIASALESAGLKKDAKIGIYATNCNEYLETQFGAFKAGCSPVNVNYRYKEAELVYLLENADAEALFFESRFAPRVAAIRQQLPKIKLLVDIADGTPQHIEDALQFESMIASHSPAPRKQQSENDVYMLYTGGTTGMPKGVMFRHGDLSPFFVRLAATARGMPVPANVEDLVDLVHEIHAGASAPIALAACPLMHGTGCWLGAFSPHSLGGLSISVRGDHFDADVLWQTVERENVSEIVIVGDAFAKPMLASLKRAQAEGRLRKLDSLKRIISSGVMFSNDVKRGLLEFLDVEIFDGMGSTESGSLGNAYTSRSTPAAETARFIPSPEIKVFGANDREIMPGSDEAGMIGTAGVWAIGYYKDEAKTAVTFRIINGVRYVFSGDYGKYAADGSLILLGRGSTCINTGGEKVFPEEVEEALKTHPDVQDCVVVGTPDERFGERVTAVVSVQNENGLDEHTLLEYGRMRLAGYKLPKRIVIVDKVQRAVNGKADYKWARAAALDNLATNER